MIFSLVAKIGLVKCCITSACLQWLCHSGEPTVARGPLVFFFCVWGGGGGGGGERERGRVFGQILTEDAPLSVQVDFKKFSSLQYSSSTQISDQKFRVADKAQQTTKNFPKRIILWGRSWWLFQICIRLMMGRSLFNPCRR